VRGASRLGTPGASERDLVVGWALSRPIAGYFRVEDRRWSSIATVAGPFLFARNTWGAPGSVVMILRDRGPATGRLFEAAAQLAAAKDSVLTVICPPTVAGEEGLEQWIADRGAESPVQAQIEIAPIEPTALHEKLGELGCRVLAFETGVIEGDGGQLRKISQRFECDILVVP
jgi:hypothetical protein